MTLARTILRCALPLAICWSISTAAGAPETDALGARLTEIETRLERASPADRAELARAADDLRARLIDAAPTDVRAPTWLIDRASQRLSALGDDGAETSVLLGLPSPEQRARVREAAAEAGVLLDRAGDLAREATRELESRILDRSGSPEEAARRAVAAEADLHTLVDVEQAQRIPYLTAQCRVLAAAARREGAFGVDAGGAQAAATALQALRERTPALDAARDVLLVCAIVNSTPALRERARDLVLPKLREIVSKADAEQATRRRARLALIVLGERAETLPADAPWEEHLADAEARARAALLAIDHGGRDRWSAVSRALEPLLRIAHLSAPSTELAESRRAMVYAKAAAAIDPGAPANEVAPELNFARAVTLLRESPRPSDAAEEMLEAVAARPEAPEALRGDALWELGVALDRRAGDGAARERQIAVLGRLVSAFATHPRATAGAEWLVAHAGPDWACLAQSDRAKARSCTPPLRPEFIRAVRMLADDPRWRLDALRIELWGAPDGPVMPSLVGAIERWRALTVEAERTAAVRDIAAASGALARTLNTAPPAGNAAADRVIYLTPVVAFLREHAPDSAPALALPLAEARLAAGDPDAAAAFEALVGSAIDLTGSRGAARIRLGLAQALRKAGRTQEAFGALRQLTDQFEKAPGEKGREEPYWNAWATILEMLSEPSSAGDGPDRTDEILASISRLELVDPTLGGPPHAARIRAVRDRIAPAPTQDR